MVLQNTLGQPHNGFLPPWWVGDSPVTHPGLGANPPTEHRAALHWEKCSVVTLRSSAQRQGAGPAPLTPARLFQQEPSCSTPALAIPRL